MNKKITMDGAGRIVLPQGVRRHFGLMAGDHFEWEIVSDGIVLHSRNRPACLVMEKGLLVHEGDSSGDLLLAVDGARSLRDEQVLGFKR